MNWWRPRGGRDASYLALMSIEAGPASVAQWAEAQCASTGTVCRRGGVQSPDRPVDFVFGFQGRNRACFEINFSGRQRGFDGVLYNL